jgi:hypothetical protein
MQRIRRWSSLAAVGLAALLATAACSSSQAQIALISFSGGGNATSASDQLYGWQFNVLTPIDVNSLGVFDDDNDGLDTRHEVGIFRTSDQALLASLTMPAGTGSALINGFRYEDLGSSVHLAPDSYVIAMTMPTQNGDLQSIGNSSVTTAPEIQYVTSRFDGGSSLAFPTTTGAFAEGMFGPNFRFAAGPSAVPEPGAIALLSGIAVSCVFLLRRHRAAL